MKAKRPGSHVQVSMLLLCLVVLLIAASLLTVDHHCTLLHERITQVITVNKEASPQETINAVEEVQQQWEQSRGWLQLFLPRQLVAEVNTGIAKLQPLADAENDELISECTALLAMLRWLGEQY